MVVALVEWRYFSIRAFGSCLLKAGEPIIQPRCSRRIQMPSLPNRNVRLPSRSDGRALCCPGIVLTLCERDNGSSSPRQSASDTDTVSPVIVLAGTDLAVLLNQTRAERKA